MCWPPLASVQIPLAQISDDDEPLIDASDELLPFFGRVARTIFAPFHMLMIAVNLEPFWRAPTAQTLSAPKLVTASSSTLSPPLVITLQLDPPVQFSQSEPRVGPES
jgi:hypothetical protein